MRGWKAWLWWMGVGVIVPLLIIYAAIFWMPVGLWRGCIIGACVSIANIFGFHEGINWKGPPDE